MHGVCMYVYMYACVYVDKYVYRHPCIMYICTYKSKFIGRHPVMFLCTYACICMCPYMYIGGHA